jgi:FkbM family methyltransferase
MPPTADATTRLKSVRKRIRQLLSRAPLLYEVGAILRLIWSRLTYSGGDAIAAIQLIPSEQGLALDIGAYRGRSAIKIAALKPNFEIISFEPNRRCRFALQLVRIMLGKRFRFKSAGLSDERAEATYYEPFLNFLPVSAEGSFLRDNLDEEMEERLGKDYEVKQRTFQLLCLDDLQLSPDFIKIDVQGWELNVLRGAHETLVRSRPVVVIERNRHNEQETARYLEELGYDRLSGGELFQHGLFDAAGDNVFVPRAAC